MSPKRKRLLSGAATVAISAGLLAIAFSTPQFTLSQGTYGPPTNPLNPLTPPPRTFVPPIVVPTDVTSQFPQSITVTGGMLTPSGTGPGLLAGFHTMPESAFPKQEELGGSPEFIEVKWAPLSEFTKPNLYSVNLNAGQVLVGVKKPSNTGMIITPIGSVAIFSNSDVLVSYKGGVLRVSNLDGLGDTVRINFNGKVYSIPPGVEFVGSDKKLTRQDLHPGDNLARRNAQVIQGENAAIIEFSVESTLEGSNLVANLQTSSAGDKERRMLNDVSRMAAVLNHLAGTEGFSQQ